MSLDLTTFKPSDFAAWWGAIVATIALLWNIYRAVRSGPRVTVSATADMQFHPRTPLTADKTYVYLTAVNHGDAPTTITHFAGFHASTFLHWVFRKKYRQHFVVPTGPLGQSIPYVLKPGEQWGNALEHEPLLEERMRTGYFYVGVFHIRRKRPVYVRVRLGRSHGAASTAGDDITKRL